MAFFDDDDDIDEEAGVGLLLNDDLLIVSFLSFPPISINTVFFIVAAAKEFNVMVKLHNSPSNLNARYAKVCQSPSPLS